ncbi:hypothetical protein FACS189487_01500 [Campylobacterota bacterium]|nr:hypothetical protein FACS189487_01500 [Campylobacterota bacterium]
MKKTVLAHPIKNYLWVFAYCGFASLAGGISAFCAAPRWFVVADTLRSLALESLLFALLLLLPPRVGKVLLLLAFPLILSIALIASLHAALYQSALSVMSVQSVLETSWGEATEFIADFTSLPLLALAVATLLAASVLLYKASRSLPHLQRGTPAIIAIAAIFLAIGGWHIYKGKRSMDSSAAYVVIKTALNYQKDLARSRDVRDLRGALRFDAVAITPPPPDHIHIYHRRIDQSPPFVSVWLSQTNQPKLDSFAR